MCTNCNKLTFTRDILVKLVLEVNERGVRARGEMDVAKDCASKVRSDLGSLHNFMSQMKRKD